MKNINTIIVSTMNFLNKLNLFGQMYKYKNMVKLIICAFAFVGLTACGGGGGGGSSTATDTANTLDDRVNLSSLENYTLANLNDTFLNEISQKIDDNTADSIIITISDNSSDTQDVSTEVDCFL